MYHRQFLYMTHPPAPMIVSPDWSDEFLNRHLRQNLPIKIYLYKWLNKSNTNWIRPVLAIFFCCSFKQWNNIFRIQNQKEFDKGSSNLFHIYEFFVSMLFVVGEWMWGVVRVYSLVNGLNERNFLRRVTYNSLHNIFFF